MSVVQGQQSASLQIPTAMKNAILFKQVTVELLNGIVISGRLVTFDETNMNMRLDSITDTVLRTYSSRDSKGNVAVVSEVRSPPQLPCMNTVAIRGNFVRCIDIVEDQGVQSVLLSVKAVRAGFVDELGG